MCGGAFSNDSFYLQSAVVEATRLAARLGYTKASSVVDIGCGLGRLALGMRWEFGNDVNYLGIDANQKYIEWCKKYIEEEQPGYKFLHLNVVNDLYNPHGTIDGSAIQLPVVSGSAEIVYLWGVFTNMGPEHVRIYVSEASRIVREEGRIFLTAFVEDSVPDISFNPIDYVPYGCNAPLSVVRYRKDYLFLIFKQNRLRIDEFRYHGGGFPKQSEIYLTKTK
jgi:ubiquinone/menaquinone biosynthesis C-methylase UbiE